MLVSHESFPEVLEKLTQVSRLSLDTETTGLRPYHGDRLFSLIIATEEFSYYFNFQSYAELAHDMTLPKEWLQRLKPLFDDPTKSWDLFNAKFDMHILAQENLYLAGEIHCCKAISLVEYNEHQNYDLASCAARIGFAKDDAVEAYITKNGLWEWETIPGKAKREKNKFYNRVPPSIIVPYGETDGGITKRLGNWQRSKLEEIENGLPKDWPSIQRLAANERRLTKTVFRMENHGVKIDRAYCVRAAAYEHGRLGDLEAAFKRETGRVYSASNPLFQEVFADEKHLWTRGKPTKTKPEGGWSFAGDALKNFKSPAAQIVRSLREAKSKSDYFQGFLYHADHNDFIHPQFNPDGAGHGRFSSSNPNLQNLTDEEDAPQDEFTVRRAIITPPGFILIMPDYDQMEYRLMLDYACSSPKFGYATELVKKVLAGMDVHQACAELASATGIPITRSQAKTVNFLTLYGGGNEKLAGDLDCSVEQASAIREAIFAGAPEIKSLIRSLMKRAEERGYIFNWFGRRCYFPDSTKAYRAPNYVIAGGCADVVKIAMNLIDEELLDKRSKLVLTVHDELPTYVHESEIATVPRKIHQIMESVYPAKYLPLTAAMEWSETNLADKKKGFPV